MASSSIRIAVLGASGRTGRLVLAEVLDHPNTILVAAVVHKESSALGTDAGLLAARPATGVTLVAAAPGCFNDAQVIIDFSLPAGLVSALPFIGEISLVSGTTGLSDAQHQQLVNQSNLGAVLRADNFSTGITVLRDLVARASRVLRDFDIEIVETHHRHKRDAPSGTALALGRSAAQARGLALERVVAHGREGLTEVRPAEQIGIHAIRGGEIVGDHTVLLCSSSETVSLSHSAISRNVFAEGALGAALWLHPKPPGVYSVEQVLGLS